MQYESLISSSKEKIIIPKMEGILCRVISILCRVISRLITLHNRCVGSGLVLQGEIEGGGGSNFERM